MWYRVFGKLKVKLWCECPHCTGLDMHRDREKVEMDIEAESSEEAIQQAMRQIKGEMEHPDASVEWQGEPEAVELGTAAMLRKLGAVELPLEV